ncbi:MAG: IS110 family transposase [Lachnospiraceae bacterium]|nr:IS110 family transposase [Ruminococcus sp.]MCM1274666.1 IS110 family transposase [Lachnospiraceae bacterium]
MSNKTARSKACNYKEEYTIIYIGIDTAKEKHFAVVTDSGQNVLHEPFGFENNMRGFSKLEAVIEKFKDSETVIGMESTAHYAQTLITFLMQRKYTVSLINPLQTAVLRKAAIRHTKTDRTDTKLIVKSMIVNGYRTLTECDVRLLQLKHLERFRSKLKKSVTQQKIRLRAVMDVIFPEFQYFFASGLHIHTSYEILKLYTSPDEIADLHLTRLANLIRKASNNAFDKETAVKLRELSKNSVGINDPVLCLEVKQLIAQIELLEQQCADIEEKISGILADIDSPIKTIPRIGDNNAAAIISEFGDLSRFDSPDQLTAFAGLDPTVNQSGKFNASGTRMSKRGSKYMRSALINAAFQLLKVNLTFKNYYDKKRSEGKNHCNALGHTAHKLVRIIFHIVKNNEAFSLP